MKIRQPHRRFERLYGFLSMIRQRYSIGLAVCAFAISLGASQAEQVYELGSGIAPPRPVHQVSPEHPAKGFRVSGTVLIGLIVSSKGEPGEVHVIRSLEKDVDQSAVDAVKQWRFEPAMKDGQPVAVRISVEIRFHDM
jgi:protein TonB